MSTKNWKGWYSIYRTSGSEDGESVARSPVYEFPIPTGPGEWNAAHAELRRRWDQAGEPLEGEAGLSRDDPTLRLHRTLSVWLGDLFLSNEQQLINNEFVDVKGSGESDDLAVIHANHAPEQAP
jgi:hypothetical protein